MISAKRYQHAFTIVELLIVIVVIAILAAISLVAFNGIRDRARDASILSDISQINKIIQVYHAQNGHYPKTQTVPLAKNVGNNLNARTYMDSNCPITPDASGTKTALWVPDITQTLPQSDGNLKYGAYMWNTSSPVGGCYMYQSDGDKYFVSAWNMLKYPQTSTYYRRVGARETVLSQQFYYCGANPKGGNIGGNKDDTYDIKEDFYKHSFTVSNITDCDETF